MAWATAAAVGAGAAGLYGAKQQHDSADDALDAQQDQNAASEAFLREQYGKGRKDALKYIPQGAEAAQKAYERAYEIANQAGRKRLNATTKGNVNAQKTLLAGLPQMNNAILGNDVDLSGLKPRTTSVGGGNGVYDAMDYSPGDVPNALAGASEDRANTSTSAYDYSIEPGRTSNASLVQQALAGGDISKRDYDWFQRYMQEGDNGSGVYWSSINEPDEYLAENALAGLAPENRGRVEAIVNMVKRNNGGMA